MITLNWPLHSHRLYLIVGARIETEQTDRDRTRQLTDNLDSGADFRVKADFGESRGALRRYGRAETHRGHPEGARHTSKINRNYYSTH